MQARKASRARLRPCAGVRQLTDLSCQICPFSREDITTSRPKAWDADGRGFEACLLRPLTEDELVTRVPRDLQNACYAARLWLDHAPVSLALA
jgi:hypothetical protein